MEKLMLCLLNLRIRLSQARSLILGKRITNDLSRERAGAFLKVSNTTPTSPSRIIDLLLSLIVVYTSWQDFDG
jgi:hypothetical protein